MNLDKVPVWVGHALLALAALLVFFFGRLWESFGIAAFLVWMVIAAAGVAIVMYGQEPPGGS